MSSFGKTFRLLRSYPNPIMLLSKWLSASAAGPKFLSSLS